MYHDEINRIGFANLHMVRELLRLLPDELTIGLDTRSLRRLPSSHVGPGPTTRLSDMPWAIGTRSTAKDAAEVLLTLEFQSRPENLMALRVEAYVALLRQDMAEQDLLAANGRSLARGKPLALLG